jgi:hypothetical protein
MQAMTIAYGSYFPPTLYARTCVGLGAVLLHSEELLQAHVEGHLHVNLQGSSRRAVARV